MVLLLMFLPELIGVLTADNEKEEPKEKKARKEPPAKKEKPQKETKRKGGAHCAK